MFNIIIHRINKYDIKVYIYSEEIIKVMALVKFFFNFCCAFCWVEYFLYLKVKLNNYWRCAATHIFKKIKDFRINDITQQKTKNTQFWIIHHENRKFDEELKRETTKNTNKFRLLWRSLNRDTSCITYGTSRIVKCKE